MKYVVYWIRRRIHQNLYEEGYVGVTNNFDRRTNYHLRYHYKTDNPKLSRAVKKYDDIIVSSIFEGSEDECYLFENKLRPTVNVGWNIAIGGSKPPLSKGRKWSSEHRQNYLSTIRRQNSNYRSSEQRQQGEQTKRKRNFVPFKNINRSNNTKATRWWNDGVTSKRSTISPGPNWVLGRKGCMNTTNVGKYQRKT